MTEQEKNIKINPNLAKKRKNLPRRNSEYHGGHGGEERSGRPHAEDAEAQRKRERSKNFLLFFCIPSVTSVSSSSPPW
jgi:hypothetical protein